MNFNQFLTKISKVKQAKLGGLDIQLEMTPLERQQLDFDKIIAKNPKEAAVLMLIYPNEKSEACFLLTKRASYKGTHSAQISFPGGKKNDTDNNMLETALRETEEEVNVARETVEIIKLLSKTYIPPSNFWVSPFIGFVKEKPKFIKNYEVDSLVEVRINQLLDDDNLTTISIETSYMKKVEVPCFKFNDHIVWGATAMILNEVKELFKNVFTKN